MPTATPLQHLLDAATALPAETLRLHEAAGRTLAADIHSGQSLPPFDNSAMDGFALRAEGRVFEPGTEFAVQGWQAAGDASAEGGEGAWEIMTGARMPSGLDTVVPVENVQVLASDAGRPTRIALTATVKPGQNVRLRGQDVSEGERVLQAGQVLDINARLLHAPGVGEVAVVARAAVIATGKELVTEAAQALESGQIRDSNRPGRLQAAGAEVVWQGTVGDEVAAFNAVLDEALAAGAQVLISTGAVSAGRYDFVPDAARAWCTHRIPQGGDPPGQAAAVRGAAQWRTVLRPAGQPVSAAVGQRFFVEPVLPPVGAGAGSHVCSCRCRPTCESRRAALPACAGGNGRAGAPECACAVRAGVVPFDVHAAGQRLGGAGGRG